MCSGLESVVGGDAQGHFRWASPPPTNGSSVCPAGFRVPNIYELNAELLDAGSAQISNRADAFTSFLVFPSAGDRYYCSASWPVEGRRVGWLARWFVPAHRLLQKWQCGLGQTQPYFWLFGALSEGLILASYSLLVIFFVCKL